MARKLEIVVLWLVTATVAGSLLCVLRLRGGPEVALGQYATRLRGRTAAQKHNAAMAAAALNGQVVKPGREVSFNRVLGPWTADRGYRKAPVSYDGELVMAWGGGVCQTSTTLYNAALLAGLEVVERHRHAWPPRYVPPGRDAAVAYPSIDLVVRNPYPWPVRLAASVQGDNLTVSVFGREMPAARIAVEGDVRSVIQPDEELQVGRPNSGRRVVSAGQPGFDVAVYRTYHRGGRLVRSELMSADHYPAMNRVVRLGE
jgi:vancomycin resistance protein VanW